MEVLFLCGWISNAVQNMDEDENICLYHIVLRWHFSICPTTRKKSRRRLRTNGRRMPLNPSYLPKMNIWAFEMSCFVDTIGLYMVTGFLVQWGLRVFRKCRFLNVVVALGGVRAFGQVTVWTLWWLLEGWCWGGLALATSHQLYTTTCASSLKHQPTDARK